MKNRPSSTTRQTSTRRNILLAVILFIAGIGCGYFLQIQSSTISLSVKRANDPSYKFINPLLTCNISENKEWTEYTPLENKINSLITSNKTNVDTVSVYFRELNSGRWFSINENQTYSPASLMKVPIMIAYLKKAETDPKLLQQKISYTGNNVISNDIEYYKSTENITPGKAFTNEELISSMIKHSDNAAMTLLFEHLDANSLEETLSDIGIHIPSATTTGDSDFLTVKSYSYLFRLLYNSTYLSRDMSEKALDLLSESDFTKGIVAGVPQNIQVAQKFGERSELEESTYKSLGRELHDCGIVYYPAHPYLLCVMTKGKDFDSLATVIKNTSSLIYQAMDERYTK